MSAVLPAPALPTVDVIIGREGHRRERLVRVQRVEGVIRLLAGERLDHSAVHILGTFTIPVMKVGELRAALAKLVH